MGGRHRTGTLCGDARRTFRRVPRPGVAVPQVWQHVDLGGLRAAVGHRDAGIEFFRCGFGVFDLHVEIALLHPLILERVVEFVFADVLAAVAVRPQQIVVGEGGLRILVDHGRVGVSRQVVGVEPVVLDVLAVVAVLVGQPVGTLLEYRIAAVPQRQPQADDLIAITPTGHRVFVPPVRATAGLFEGEVRPRVAVGAVVFADGTPGAFTDVGAPASPVDHAGFDFVEAIVFCRAQGIRCDVPGAIRSTSVTEVYLHAVRPELIEGIAEAAAASDGHHVPILTDGGEAELRTSPARSGVTSVMTAALAVPPKVAVQLWTKLSNWPCCT